MNKAFKLWVVGGLITVSVFGYGFATKLVSAADTTSHSTNGQMDPKVMADMMATADFQQRCSENMKNPEMQKAMMNLMRQPEMQAALKQMMQHDMSFHQLMLDLVNSVDMKMDHGDMNGDSMMNMNMSGMDHR